MLIALLILNIFEILLIILIYPILAYVTDKNTDMKLKGRDEKSMNLESRVFMNEARMENLERVVSAPIPRATPTSSMPDGIVMRGTGKQEGRDDKKDKGMAGIPRG